MDTVTISQAARRLMRTVKTLQRWDREGTLKARRTKTNRRYYAEAQLASFLGEDKPQDAPKRAVAYLRVSSVAQRPDMENQRKILSAFCRHKKVGVVEYMEEVKGGLNFKRPKFAALMDAIERREVGTLVVAHKDRLCRFGFEWFRRHCENHGCRLLVVDNKRMSPEREMVQDLMTIVHCFSSRLYGLRNYRVALKEALRKR